MTVKRRDTQYVYTRAKQPQ